MADIYERTVLGECLKQVMQDVLDEEVQPPHLHDPWLEAYDKAAATALLEPAKALSMDGHIEVSTAWCARAVRWARLT